MASSDFTGTYRVLRTSGTPFGLDTVVTIGEPEEEDVLPLVFVPPNQEPSPWTALYDEETESLAFELPAPARSLHLSRYSDPRGYEAVYGVVLMEDLRLAVFSAEKEEGGSGSQGGSRISASAFSGTYLVAASAGAQFGLGSRVTVGEAEGDAASLAITDVFGRALPAPATVRLHPETGSLKGSASATLGEEEIPIFVQLSRLTVPRTEGPEVRVAYGLFVVGDPQQGGVFAGQDPGDPPSRL